MAHIQKRKRGKSTSYVVRWTEPDGTERSESFTKLGRYDFPGTAEHYKHQLETNLGHGTYVNPDMAKTLLRVEVDKWVERAHTETTCYQRRNFAKNLGRLGGMPIGEIRPSDIRDWLDQLHRGRPWENGKPLGENSVALHFQFLRTVLNIAIDDGILTVNPCKRVKTRGRPDGTKSVTQLLTVDQVWALIGKTNKQTGCMMLISAQTGLRPSEVAGLRVCDVDFLRREIHVVQQANHFRGKPPTARLKTRTSKRTVPLPADAHEALSAFLAAVKRERHDLAFRNKAGNPWCADGMGERFRAVAKQAKVPDHFTWHDLRHFYASALIQNGASVKTVQVRLGHADAETTLKVYTHLSPDQDAHTRAAIESVFVRPEGDTPEEYPLGNEVVSELRRDADGTAAAS
ncbi:tyrosine-type recombinase/integrase [Nocardia otitidiscaviarum]|uniref:tyrosine-type recombinase/integrase n=1 Tax=Nocardia otitidiscaviarum TaxID=1823 RepID=UPI00245614C4|nr:site-specific integrase [Nocardia otitidiscaviarum]